MADFKDIAEKITALAPVLGTAIGGPAGGAIGLGVQALARAFGLKPDATPAEIEQAIKTDPESAIKLRIAEMDFQIQLRGKDLDELNAKLQDVANAREREVNITKNTGRKDTYLYALASVIVICFFALCILLMWRPLPQGSSEVVFMLFGALSAGFGSVVGYFFGSSKSSSDKTDLLTKNNL